MSTTLPPPSDKNNPNISTEEEQKKKQDKQKLIYIATQRLENVVFQQNAGEIKIESIGMVPESKLNVEAILMK